MSDRRVALRASFATNAVDQLPHVAAGIVVLRRAVSFVLLIESLRPSPRFRVPLFERPESVGAECLIACEELPRPCLRFAPLEVRGLIAKVEEEPEFDARIRQNHADAVRGGLLDRLGDVGVLVAIEHTPHLIVRTAATSLVFLRLGALGLDGVVHKLQRPAVERVDRDEHPIAELPPPVDEVTILGPFAFGENEDLVTIGRGPLSSEAPRMARVQLSTAVMRSAAATNS